ncbi:hypothetical protein CHLRE_10g454734v5 [Chlamydomonas reinhardtii]|uniref:Chlorophyll a-b binding protein, chloroplastic n=1 Tax=Chlamydomonas reinhardtii TaxID=3055 RepID=A0A2K3DBG1_CHLRE|nr:uncharacterized protein CHLRE_10g454734v5 [Chlamydomonas reinhardtii]PNW77861.1 hypothetical protein CHLRE_10g454734v5 [Chlamydomonas reinhardtii]
MQCALHASPRAGVQVRSRTSADRILPGPVLRSPLGPLSSRAPFSTSTLKHQPEQPSSQVACPASVDYGYPSAPELPPERMGEAARRALSRATSAVRRYGWLSFWAQLTLSVVGGVILLFSVAFTSQSGPKASLYLTLFGILAGFLSTFWNFGYTRTALKMQSYLDAAPGQEVPKIKKQQVVDMVTRGIFINMMGLASTLAGVQALVGMLVAKTLQISSYPFMAAASNNYNPVVALDVFLVQAATNTLLGHFVSLACSLWLLHVVGEGQGLRFQRFMSLELLKQRTEDSRLPDLPSWSLEGDGGSVELKTNAGAPLRVPQRAPVGRDRGSGGGGSGGGSGGGGAAPWRTPPRPQPATAVAASMSSSSSSGGGIGRISAMAALPGGGGFNLNMASSASSSPAARAMAADWGSASGTAALGYAMPMPSSSSGSSSGGWGVGGSSSSSSSGPSSSSGRSKYLVDTSSSSTRSFDSRSSSGSSSSSSSSSRSGGGGSSSALALSWSEEAPGWRDIPPPPAPRPSRVPTSPPTQPAWRSSSISSASSSRTASSASSSLPPPPLQPVVAPAVPGADPDYLSPAPIAFRNSGAGASTSGRPPPDAAGRLLILPSVSSLSYLDGTLPGDMGFDPLGLFDPTNGSAGFMSQRWLHTAEVVHGRWAMLGAAGCLAPEYLAHEKVIPKATGLLWFKTGFLPPVSAGFDYGLPVTALFLIQMGLMGTVESLRWAELSNPGSLASNPLVPQPLARLIGTTRLGGGAYPGGLMFNPLGLGATRPAVMREYQQSEIRHGRLAMVACLGYAAQAVVTGKGPYTNWVAHLEDPDIENVVVLLDKLFA